MISSMKPPLPPKILQKIEKRMQEITATDSTFSRREMSREEAVALFKEKGESYKVELINDLPPDVKTVSLYSQGEYVDLCRGPHLPSTRMIKAFKLLNVAGAYWRGDERNKMLQRIYGTGFATQEALDDYLRMIEEAKKRDHRRLGQGTGSLPDERRSRTGTDHFSSQGNAAADTSSKNGNGRSI